MGGTVAAAWRDYWGLIWQNAGALPPPDGSSQYNETRRAFYAGVFILLSKLAEAADSLTEDQAAAELKAAHEEVMAFYEDVKAGRA